MGKGFIKSIKNPLESQEKYPETPFYSADLTNLTDE